MSKLNEDGNLLGRVLALAVLAGSAFFFMKLFRVGCCNSCSTKGHTSEVRPAAGENLRDAMSDAIRRWKS